MRYPYCLCGMKVLSHLFLVANVLLFLRVSFPVRHLVGYVAKCGASRCAPLFSSLMFTLCVYPGILLRGWGRGGVTGGWGSFQRMIFARLLKKQMLMTSENVRALLSSFSKGTLSFSPFSFYSGCIAVFLFLFYFILRRFFFFF